MRNRGARMADLDQQIRLSLSVEHLEQRLDRNLSAQQEPVAHRSGQLGGELRPSHAVAGGARGMTGDSFERDPDLAGGHAGGHLQGDRLSGLDREARPGHRAVVVLDVGILRPRRGRGNQ
jgi:hypothetical protein